MKSQYSEYDIERAILTINDVVRTIDDIILWNMGVRDVDSYHTSQAGMQLLAANCTLITAIGEGINRCNRALPGFLEDNFPNIPWKAIIGMRNHIAHGYFELDSEIVFEAVKNDIPPLKEVLNRAVNILRTQDSL